MIKQLITDTRNKIFRCWPVWRTIIVIFIIAGLAFISAPDVKAQHGAISKKPLMSPLEFKEKLKGPILSAPTAFTQTFEVDYTGMAKVIKHALDFGCKVITLTSGNSRYDRLSYQEIKKLTRLLVETVGQRGVTIGATGNWGLDTVIDYVHYAEKIGASAIQVDPPKNSEIDSNIEKTVKFYKIVAQNTRLGIVLHGFYSVKLLNELIKIKSIIALKEDIPDLNYYVDRQIVFGKRLAIFAGGSDARYLFGYPYGSPAYFSVLYSYAPDIGLKFWKAIQTKDLKEAVAIATKYDFPFMKRWSFPFWVAAIEYLGGSQRYIRPRPGETQNQQTMTEEELIKMQEFLCGLGLKPPKCKYCGIVTESIALPQSLKRGGHIGGKVNGNIIVAGGNNWSEDKKTKYWLKNSVIFRNGKWEPGPDLPKPIAYSMYANDNSGLYVAGGTGDGKSVLNEVYRLQSLNKGWETLPNLPIAVGYGSGAILNGKFYVACGSIDTVKTNKMWVLDISKVGSKWHECSPVPGVSRMFPSLVACGENLYLLGGLAETSPLTPLKDAYRYDPQKNQWTQLTDLLLDGYAWVSQPVDNNHLIITGRAYGKVDKGIWIIDLKDMSMNKVGNDINPATTAPLINVADKQWWLVGGEPDANKNRTGKVSVITLK